MHCFSILVGGAVFACACGTSSDPDAPPAIPSTGSSTGASGTGTTSSSTGTSGGHGSSDASSSEGGAGGAASIEAGGGGFADAALDSAVIDPGTKGDGDYTVGPDYPPHPDVLVKSNVPHGKIFMFTMDSHNSAIFPGTASTLLPTNQHYFLRAVRLYVPSQYVDGTAAPFMVVQDGDRFVTDVQNSLDNLIAAKKVPAMLAVFVNNGGGDGKGSERGLEYDTMSDAYSRFIDTEVLPAVTKDPTIKAAYPNLRFTENPEGRSSYGCSSGAAAALTMGWFTPDRYRRLVTYSGTFVDQQDDDAPTEAQFPLGAWEYHSSLSLITSNPVKPLRVFLNANENDLRSTDPESTYHNWVMANQRTAAALKAKGYHYRFVFGKGVGHCDTSLRRHTLPDTLEWMWQGYPIN